MFGLTDGDVKLLQIGGGGKIMVGRGEAHWWENPRKKPRDWKVQHSEEGQCYDTEQEALEVVANLSASY